MKLFISLERYVQRLEQDLFTSLENIHCDVAKWKIRLTQTRYRTPANFDHPPPISLFHIHNRLYYGRLIFRRLIAMHEKARQDRVLVERKIIHLLSNLPKEFINIVFNWVAEDVEDHDDKETIKNYQYQKYQHFYGNEEWNVASIFTCICVCVSINKQFWKYSQFIFSLLHIQ